MIYTNLRTIALGTGRMVLALFMVACAPDGREVTAATERQESDCLDSICPGDQEPQHDFERDEVLKLNGRWFIGPKLYFSSGTNGAAFFWPSKMPVREAPQVPRNEDVVEIFLRSKPLPKGPRGYALVELAEKNHWIAERTTLRPGLDQVRMKHEVSPNGQYLDNATYYVATDLRGPDGLPPVAACSHDDARNGGGSGFFWRDGIWAGTRMSQRLCVDWPEIYLEVVRVLSQLKEFEQ